MMQIKLILRYQHNSLNKGQINNFQRVLGFKQKLVFINLAFLVDNCQAQLNLQVGIT